LRTGFQSEVNGFKCLALPITELAPLLANLNLLDRTRLSLRWRYRLSFSTGQTQPLKLSSSVFVFTKVIELKYDDYSTILLDFYNTVTQNNRAESIYTDFEYFLFVFLPLLSKIAIAKAC
jgi:hypothetical protein